MKKTVLKRTLAFALTAALAASSGVFPQAASSVKAAESVPTLTINMAPDEERELKHGASGFLYGLGAENVPTANTITPLKAHTAVQKAPNGMQHPNGDVLDTVDTFMNAGGKDLQIYVPDYYALWFYEFSSTEEYLDILKMEAEECIEKGIAEDAVYVLYNEPKADWLGGSYLDPETQTTYYGWESLFWFWEDMYNMLVEVYEDNGVAVKPRVAGLNLAEYDEDVMEQYIKFCVEHSCMPDVITWHDLSTWQFNAFDSEYKHYRNLEKTYLTEENAEKYGVDITPREIVINEYADWAECASPGDLVRWIGLFEEYNVNGCLPFWHLSNNLNGLAAGNNEGNGAWWLYKWYGDMSGQYLPVTTSNTTKDNYYGAASLDENKKNSTIIFGGVNGSSDIVLENLDDTETFKDAELLHVKLESTDYTGFHGAAEEPRTVKEGAVEIKDGKAVIPVSDMLEMSGYRLTLTQASEDETAGFLSDTWKELYEAEDGEMVGGAAPGDVAWNFAGSGRQKVNAIYDANAGVNIKVTVPADGYYKYDMVYTTAQGCNTADPDANAPLTAAQTLYVDGQQMEKMILPTTLNWSMGGMYSTYIYLEAGPHTLGIRGTENTRFADVDCIYLTYKGPNEEDVAFNKTYEAELGEFNELSGTDTALTTERKDNTDYVSGLDKTPVTAGGGLRFTVIVPEDGMYTLGLRYSSDAEGNIRIYQDNDAVHLDRLTASATVSDTEGLWENAYQTVFLQKGINIIDLDADVSLALDYMNVQKTDAEPSAVVEAESGKLSGEAALGSVSEVKGYASGNSYVAGIKAANGVEVIGPDDPDFEIYGRGRAVDMGEAVDKNSLTITVNVPEAGEYKMAVYQSSGELFGKHDYNAQMTERYASFSVNGGEAQKVVFRNTYSDETFRAQVVPVTLKAGENTIKIYNDNSKVITNGIHNGGDKIPANITYNVLENYTPNFDRFEFWPVTAESEVTETQTYKVSASYTDGGIVSADKTRTEAGGTVQITFTPDDGAALTEATVNGDSVIDKLTQYGGVYVLSNVQSDVEVKGYFETAEEDAADVKYYYSVNCGDIDPATLSPGDVFGEYNSVTDQFYGADTKTGKMWGVVDTYVEDENYPGWLTGAKTWPCENDGATDESSRGKSFRYARNQATTEDGVVYQFELEKGKEYALELGFYVPSNWTNAAFPRTMKLVLNGTTVNESFTASNNADDPFIIRTTGTADGNGMLKVQVGHAANAAWGPVVSYIDIMEKTDTSKLQETVEAIKDKEYDSEDYSAISWERFEEALAHAEDVLKQDAPAQKEIDLAQKQLLEAEQGLASKDAYSKLEELAEQYADCEKGLTSDAEWNAFENALANAQYALESTRFSTGDLESFAKKLSDAADALLTAVSIEVTNLPDVTEYYVGDAFNPAGLTVEAVDNKGGRHTLTEQDYTLSGYDQMDKAGTVTITVTYGDNTDTFDITVKERSETPVTLKSLEITKKGKTEYKLGEKFSTEGMEVTVYYTDGGSKQVTDYKVEGFDSETAGQKQVKISYTEGGITVEAVLDVTVVSEQNPDPGTPDPGTPDPGTPNPGTPGQPGGTGGSSDTEKPGNTGDGEDQKKAAQTGDNTPLALLFGTAAVSAGAVLAVFALKRRKHS